MKKRYLILPAIVLLLVMSASDVWSRSIPRPVGNLDRNQAIEKLFQGRALDRVEGIWVSESNSYEIAIFRNKPDEYKAGDYQAYDYLGVVVSSTSRYYLVGELQCVLKKAAGEDTFPGRWVGSPGLSWGTTFILLDENTIGFLLSYGSDRERRILFRTYPQGGASPAATGHGTGFFIAPDLVVTADHVIAGAKEITLTLADGTKVPATTAVRDQANDVALLKTNRHIDQVATLPIGAAPRCPTPRAPR